MLKSKFPEITERAIENPSTPVEIIFLRFSCELTELFPITLILLPKSPMALRRRVSVSANIVKFFITETVFLMVGGAIGKEFCIFLFLLLLS